MKKLIILLLLSITLFSQEKKSSEIGQVILSELNMNRYEKDTTANAVVLYEHANYYVDEKRDYKKTTDYYFKVKILNKEGTDNATIAISDYGSEKLHSIKAITYNLSEKNKITKTHLLKNNIYKKDLGNKWRETTFTLPNIKIGSVIEYSYSITSPYSKIDDWEFQADIPKIKSDFTASILANWKYNTRLIGFLKLNRDNTSIKKKCVYVPGLVAGNCLVLDYGMDNIPAFKEENYMLSKENYISKLSFELQSYTDPRGRVKKYTKTWKDADKKLKYDFLDNQSSKKSYFKKQLSLELLSKQNNLERATKIFEFIQNHYTWNEKYWPSKKVRIKKAFENKIGTIFDINLSLYNSLKAANIESYLVLTSTRNVAVPTKLHPVINDFNYLLVKTIINNKTYFLDATNKQLPFGLVQYTSLNGDGRVMDFKSGSYWEPIQLNKKTYRTTKAKLAFDDEGELKGNLLISSDGYFAVNDREKLNNKSSETFIEDFESDHSNLEVDDFEHKNLEQNNSALHQNYKITFEQTAEENKFRINPFLITKYTKNPFKLKERHFPVDFSYPRNNTFILSLKLPKGYIVKKLPESKAISLPNKGGKFILSYKKKDNTISVYSKIMINKKTYSSNEYQYLKEFFNQIIKSQDTFIDIEKMSK